jgi:SDR family mycofactocin-dependent oxidoreductase
LGVLDGKVALITGAARGQGRAHALASAREGARIVAVDVNGAKTTAAFPLATRDEMAQTVAEVEALGGEIEVAIANVRSQSELDGAVAAGIDRFGQIDILIANAGTFSRGRLWEFSEDVWSEMIDVNLSGVWRSIKAVAPHMIERGTGSIVVTSSIFGFETSPNYGHYVAAKHGCIGLVKNFALELGPYGIRCNSVATATVSTPMVNNQEVWNMTAGHDHGTPEDLLSRSRKLFALRGTTVMEPEVVAEAVLFLNSPAAAKITGVTLPVDGGHLVLPGINLNPVL